MGKERTKSVEGRITNAIIVIDYAIANSISVKEASVKCGFSDTYVKNIKSVVYDKFNSGDLDLTYYKMFTIKYAQYLGADSFSSQKKNIPETPHNTNIPPKEHNKPKDIPSGGNRETFKSKGNEAEYEWVGGSNYPSDHIRTVDQLLAATC